jgi:hypothetical protein
MTAPDRIQITHQPRTMTTPDFRALCAELLQAWQFGDDTAGPMNRARAALEAEPEGEGPTLANVEDLCAEFGFHYDNDQGETLEILRDMITAAVARWGHPHVAAPEPGENLATPPAPVPGEGMEAGESVTHDLKVWSSYFGSLLDGTKNFEVRLNDRDFKSGHYLRLREWLNNEYTGRELTKRVTYVLQGGLFGLEAG